MNLKQQNKLGLKKIIVFSRQIKKKLNKLRQKYKNDYTKKKELI